MSIENPDNFDFRNATLRGLATFQGDPEVAADLGIPVSAEDMERQVAAGRKVATVLTHAREEAEREYFSPAAEAMMTWVEQVKYQSQLKLGSQIAQLVQKGEITAAESDAIFKAIAAKKNDLTHKPRRNQ